MALSISNEMINQAGFVALVFLSLYMLAAYGEALHQSDRRGLRMTGFIINTIKGDIRLLVIGFASVLTAVLGWIHPGSFGHALAGLSGWISPIWFWFTALVTSSLNVVGITDFGIEHVLIAAVVLSVAAYVIRSGGLGTYQRLTVGVMVVFAFVWMSVGLGWLTGAAPMVDSDLAAGGTIFLVMSTLVLALETGVIGD